MTTREDGREWVGYALAVGLMVMGLVKAVFFAVSMYRSWLMGMHIKTMLISAIYNKVSDGQYVSGVSARGNSCDA